MRSLTEYEAGQNRREIFCRILLLAEASHNKIEDDVFFEKIISQIREERQQFLEEKEQKKRERISSGEGLFND